MKKYVRSSAKDGIFRDSQKAWKKKQDLIEWTRAGNPLEITPEQRDMLSKVSIRDYYLKEYPDDAEIGGGLSNISFADLLDGMNKGESVYDLMNVGDSVVREGLFTGLSEMLGCDYDVIYYLWLKR